MKQKLLGKGFAFRNNYLTAIIILLLFSFGANAQWTRPNTSFGSKSYRASHDSTLLFPTGCGTPSLRLAGGSLSGDTKKAALFFDSCGAVLYRYDPSAASWAAVGGLSSSDTSSKWLTQVYRSHDSVFTVKGGTATFAYKDSVGGGAGNTIYNADDTISSTRQVYLPNGRTLQFNTGNINASETFLFNGDDYVGDELFVVKVGGIYAIKAGATSFNTDIPFYPSAGVGIYGGLTVHNMSTMSAGTDSMVVRNTAGTFGVRAIPSGGSGGTDNLNDVAGRDSNTVHSLKVQGNYKYIGVESLSAFSYAFLNNYPGSGGFLSLANPSGYGGYLYADLLTTDREFRFPDTSGTLVSRVKVNGTTYNSSTKGTIDLGTISGSGGTDSSAIHLPDGITSPSTYVLKFSNLVGDTTTVTIDTTGMGVQGIDTVIGKDNKLYSDRIIDMNGHSLTINNGSSLQLTSPVLLDGNNHDAVGGLQKVTCLVFRGELRQTGTSDPVLTEFENTTGFTFTCTRAAAGDYDFAPTSGTPFTTNKTWISIGSSAPNFGDMYSTTYTWDNTSNISINTQSLSGGASDDILGHTSIEIRIYP